MLFGGLILLEFFLNDCFLLMISNKNEPVSYTDNGILCLLKKDSEEALSLLVYRYYDDLFRYGSGLCEKVTLVEDVIQDLFCELWQKRGRLENIEHIKPYLFTSLRNRIFRQLKQDKRTVGVPEIIEFNFDVDFSPEDLMIKKQDREETALLLSTYIDQLSSRQREAVYLRFYENLSYEAISGIMNITVPYLYLLIHKSVTRLRKMIHGQKSPL